MSSCIIIGAGITGITAAKHLADAGWDVTVLDKGRGIGGRMATRRIENAVFDHGAQYFSAQDVDFQRITLQLEKSEVAELWHLEEMELPEEQFKNPRWIGKKGMSSIPKHLSIGLNILTNQKVSKITSLDAKFHITTDSNEVFIADELICTIPAPQVLDLLKSSEIELTNEAQLAFNNIIYQPCIAVMAVLNKKSNIPYPGGIKFENADVSWIADNFQKGISSDFGVTIHTSPAFTEQHLEDDLMMIGKNLLNQMSVWIEESSIITYQVHRWRYSLASKRYHSKYITVGQDNPIYFGGDGFGNGNIEGAFQSGLAMARAILKA